MSQQQFCLKWNNYQSNMSEVFLGMLAEENMVDVTLACDGTNLKAHKMVLAACSPYFQSLFMTTPCKHPIVILKDVRFIDLKAIIDFMYRGEVNVSQDQLSPLLKTAETLKVKGLTEVSEKQARVHGSPIHQAFIGNSTKKKRKRPKKSGVGGKDSCESSESEDEPLTGKIRNSESSSRSNLPKMGPQKLLGKAVVSEQIEPSRILEQSMATAEVGGENGQDSTLVGFDRDVQTLDDDAMGQTLFDDGTTLGQTTEPLMLSSATPGTQATLIVFGQGAANLATPQNNNHSITTRTGSKTPPQTNSGNSPPKTFECTVCKLKFASNYNLKRHARTHDASRPRWQCNYCDKSFTRRDSLPKHMNFVHKDQLQNDGIKAEDAGHILLPENPLTNVDGSPGTSVSCEG